MQLKRNKEMEFETLKKSYKKQIIIGALAVCVIGGTLTFNLTKAKYRVDGNIDLAKGTINYKAYDFKIMAMYQSEDGSNYNEINVMPESGYVINEEKTYCTTDNKTQVKGKIKTIDGNHIISNLAKSDKCYLYFDKKTSVDNASELLAKVQSEAKTTTPDFSQTATTDEGVYAVSDGMYGGTSYYWRGAVTNNYVRFANFCWRIIRINGDGSIRLIYDGTTCHANGTSTVESIAVTSAKYNSKYNQSNYVGWTYEGQLQRPTNNASGASSDAKSRLESWYGANITGTNASMVIQGNYCNDRDVQGYTWAIKPTGSFRYAAYHRIDVGSPTLSCLLGDIYTLNIGLITVDEVMYAGGKYANNISYYLYNGQTYWTMSPCSWSYFVDTDLPVDVFRVNSNGYITGEQSVYDPRGLRPVINLKADITFSGGDGTLDNPYIVTD